MGGKWVGGATGPALARFKGTNKNRLRRWSHHRHRGRVRARQLFEFAMTSGPLAVAKWRYEFGDLALGGCRVMESWIDKRNPWFAFVARVQECGPAHRRMVNAPDTES